MICEEPGGIVAQGICEPVKVNTLHAMPSHDFISRSVVGFQVVLKPQKSRAFGTVVDRIAKWRRAHPNRLDASPQKSVNDCQKIRPVVFQSDLNALAVSRSLDVVQTGVEQQDVRLKSSIAQAFLQTGANHSGIPAIRALRDIQIVEGRHLPALPLIAKNTPQSISQERAVMNGNTIPDDKDRRQWLGGGRIHSRIYSNVGTTISE